MRISCFLGSFALLLASSAAAQDSALHWPRWRGPLETGEAPGANPPVEFSLEKNLLWSTPIPGTGHATPIVVGDRMFVLAAVPLPPKEGGPAAAPEAPQEPPPGGEASGGRGERGGRGGRGGRGQRGPIAEHEFRVMAVDRNNGKIAWNTLVRAAKPHEGVHQTATYASSSPITDGKRIYASFGSFGLHCLDLTGKVLWSKDLGPMRMVNEFGEGASPALHEGVLVVAHDHEGDSFIVALKAESGDELWRKEREESSNWTTPLIRQVGNRTQLIVPGTVKSIGYDLKTGEEIWHTTGMTRSVIPAPVYADGVVYMASGFRGSMLQAVKVADAKGDATESPAMLWKHAEGTPYVPSLLLVNGRLYFFNVNTNRLSCLDAKTGTPHYAKEIVEALGQVYASPVAAAGKVYLASREGDVVVLKEGPKLEVLAANEIGEPIDASPVIVGNHLYVRGHAKLYCFAEKGAQ